MSDLPGGTVTLLFSDMVGSTRLLSQLGPEYVDVLDDQRRLMRAAFQAHGGIELGTEGDSFYVVFADALDAVKAAVDAQASLSAHQWPRDAQVLVRMGIHTGTPVVHDAAYVGMDVHRGARISSAAHGGQVLLSAATAHAVRGTLPRGVAITDLGSHRLKDLPSPERIFSLRIDGLASQFPPLRSLGAVSRLPTPATALVGRVKEITDVSGLLSARTSRLVTLTGPGGAGKTRLAIAVAHGLIDAFPDGVYFVPLAQVSEPAAVWTSIAEVLDVPAQSRTPPQVYDHLAEGTRLFVLDNLEQLTGAGPVVEELLRVAPGVALIATSRKPLHIADEQEYAVPPLELPSGTDLADVEQSNAVRLFLDRSRRARYDFHLGEGNAADVASICRRLDGLPLAIELAAARSRLLSPHALLTRLDRALDLQAAGAQGPARQRTLRSTIDWSYTLLDDASARFFRRLSVFAGGADLCAIETVAHCDDALVGFDVLDLVAALADASLVTIIEAADGEPRIGMLQTMRVYALEKLTLQGEAAVVRTAHAEYYTVAAEQLATTIRGPQHRESRALFVRDLDNLRAALAWTTGADANADADGALRRLGLRLCNALSGYWAVTGSAVEAIRWITAALESVDDDTSAEVADCLTHLARFERVVGRRDLARTHAAAAVEMWERLGTAAGESAMAYNALAMIESERGEQQAARKLFERSLTLARESSDAIKICSVLINYAFFVGESTGDYELALSMESEALERAEELGDPAFVMRCLENAAVSMRMLGRLEEARDLMHTLMSSAFELDTPVQRVELAEDYAAVLAELGDTERAVWMLGVADAERARLGMARSSMQDAELSEAIELTRSKLESLAWESWYAQGREVTVQAAFDLAIAGSATDT